jgi:ligand-binding sensor domain-containing protein/anti-sigma regulatory factor (Ser/Thr protein kinase)
MRNWTFPIFALILAMLAALAAAAANAQIRIHRTLTVDDGLAQTQVLDLYEDRDGFLWFGTNDGVSRYDGSELTSLQSPDIPPGPVHAVRQTPDGVFFFATDRGVVLQRDGRFELPPAESGLRDQAVIGLEAARDGSLYFILWNGLIVRGPDGRYRSIPLAGLPPKTNLSAVLATREGGLLLGTYRGLFVRAGERFEPVPEIGEEEVTSLHEARDGSVWIGTDHGLAVLRQGRPETVERLAGAPTGAVLDLDEGADGTLYAATGGQGLFVRRPSGAWETITTANGLTWNLVHAVHETRDGAVYLGTERGVNVWDRGLIESWTPENGLSDRIVWSIAEDPKGGMWVAAGRGIAHREIDGPWSTAGLAALASETVRCVLASRSGAIYAGSQTGGLAIFDHGTFHRLDRASGLPDNFVRALWEAPDGAVWAGTSHGIAVIRGGRVARVLGMEDGLPSPLVSALAPGPGGSLWIGTYGGLARLDGSPGGGVRVWKRRDGLPDDVIWSLRPGRDGELYVGTARGLSVLGADGRIRTTIGARGPGARLTNDTVYCVLQDAAGRVYASTNRGVNVIDFSNGFSAASARVRTIQRADGLGSNEGNLGSCLRDSRGRLWFGTVAGVSVYDPSRERASPEPPRVRISGVRLFDRDLPPAAVAGARFGSRDNYFQLSFVGIDLAAPQRVRYRYRLAGLDRRWLETDRRSVQYTNLDPGNYRFQVQAAEGWGPWSRPAELRFSILTPIWRRWWFVALAVLLAASLIALLPALRVRQLLAIERLRTALAADLHDHIGAGLTEIAILSEIAAHRTGGTGGTGGMGGAGAVPELGRIADTARQLVDRMNDIVWLVNPRRDSLHELFLRLKDSYSELFSHAGVLFRTSNLSLFEGVRLPMSYRENLYLIFKEALNNSLRHSGCQEIELAVALQGRRLEVVLRDDGRGFEPASPGAPESSAGGNGLVNMRSRAERIGGRLAVETSRGKGTAVRFAGVLP